jgi:hypothetical protein
MKSEAYDYTVKNPNFKYAKWDASKNGYFDKYGNQQNEYITKHVDAATMFDINKTIMRCLVKNLAMFGLGLYIYAGEDLPEEEANKALDNSVKESAKRDEEASKPKHYCAYCGKEILPAKKKDGTVMTADDIAKMSLANFGAKLCSKCMADPKAIEAAR